ncbi:MAG: glycerol-3-phosphate 1-O-acyltransferase PlsY [Gammaproteobacteria bacterium]|nr:glycerol-3-phosphate 1-O-acyltransferase PlsY [Gammaproteobacteria bacterium]NVK88148.1 glycerol-3-phosphate 1-O-acyltransferase PlsY [Gammaproteobacteria bacterium]
MELSGFSYWGILLALASYGLGSVSSAILLCRLAGYGDPRLAGSKNPGATNVMRIGGKKLAILTLLGDSLKGAVPVAAAVALNLSQAEVNLVAVSAFLGHLFPVFFRFKGGKGVATFFGVIIVLNWQLALFAATCWLTSTWAFKISSLSALITAFTIPVYTWHFFPDLFIPLLIVCVLMVIRHHQNIRNLMTGVESSSSSVAS